MEEEKKHKLDELNSLVDDVDGAVYVLNCGVEALLQEFQEFDIDIDNLEMHAGIIQKCCEGAGRRFRACVRFLRENSAIFVMSKPNPQPSGFTLQPPPEQHELCDELEEPLKKIDVLEKKTKDLLEQSRATVRHCAKIVAAKKLLAQQRKMFNTYAVHKYDAHSERFVQFLCRDQLIHYTNKVFRFNGSDRDIDAIFELKGSDEGIRIEQLHFVASFIGIAHRSRS